MIMDRVMIPLAFWIGFCSIRFGTGTGKAIGCTLRIGSQRYDVHITDTI